MKTIFEAKKELRELYKNEEGFVGVGIGQQNARDTIRVYVSDARFCLVEKLNQVGEYEGFPLEIQTVGTVEALPIRNF